MEVHLNVPLHFHDVKSLFYPTVPDIDIYSYILLTAIGLTPVAAVQYTFTHRQYTERYSENRIQHIRKNKNI